MKELVKKIKAFESGDKITLITKNLFGEVTEVKATYRGNLKPYGYINKTSGSWALYPGHGFDIKCYKINIKPYRCAITRTISLFDVVDIKKGW